MRIYKPPLTISTYIVSPRRFDQARLGWAFIRLGPLVISTEIEGRKAQSRFVTQFHRLPNITIRLRITMPWKDGDEA